MAGAAEAVLLGVAEIDEGGEGDAGGFGLGELGLGDGETGLGVQHVAAVEGGEVAEVGDVELGGLADEGGREGGGDAGGIGQATVGGEFLAEVGDLTFE